MAQERRGVLEKGALGDGKRGIVFYPKCSSLSLEHPKGKETPQGILFTEIGGGCSMKNRCRGERGKGYTFPTGT